MTDEKQIQMTDDEKEELRLKYKVALDQLRLHPTLIWTRNNFFLLTETGLLAFLSKNITQQNTRLGFLVHIGLCIIGLFVAIIWMKVNWAGQTLQRNWREIVRVYEAKLFGEGIEDQESENAGLRQSIKSTVRLLLGRSPEVVKAKSNISADAGPFLQGSLEGRTRSISITSHLINLSRGFVVLWIVLLILICWLYVRWEQAY